MRNAISEVPPILNEPILGYEPGTPQRDELKKALKQVHGESPELTMRIGGVRVSSDTRVAYAPPHETKHTLFHYYEGNEKHVAMAVDAALKAHRDWSHMPWDDRAAIFLKAADLIAGPYRARMNAITMLGQSKNAYQAEIDAVCEFVDFLRYNVEFVSEIYREQPFSPDGMWNRMEYRPLEGFVFAVPPFNFTSICGNLATAPAMLGNTVVWKPSYQTNFAASFIMDVLEEAGLPDGVINLVFAEGPVAGDVCIPHPDLAGLHFTGSVGTLERLWKEIASNLGTYRTYPTIVGETGGKDFVVAHPSADPRAVATALARAAFEYQGQKCSAASRAYIPSNLWKEIKELLVEDVKSFDMGPVEDFRNFINAVIDQKAFEKITGYIDMAKKDKQKVLVGGKYSDAKGWFVEPTVILTDDPGYRTMREEIFGPVLSVYVYDENEYSETLELIDHTSPYGLTGAVFSRERAPVIEAMRTLEHAAGNFYINDKPTAAVVNQQPFGGARKSGTNDKAGSKMNLYRWVSPRSIKETFVAPKDYRYPFMKEK